MGKDKLYQARMDGLAYALDIVKKGGVEALEKEIKIRGAHFVPLEISEEKRVELGRMLSDRILGTFTPAVMFTLHDTFGFGKKRLLRWKDAFMKCCSLLGTCDPLGVPYEGIKDYAAFLRDRYGIEFDWDTISEVQQENNAAHQQICSLEYVVNLLKEHGHVDAAMLLEEYGKR